MKTLEDYIREYDLEEIQGYYRFKNPCNYPVVGRLLAYSKIKPYNVYAAADIFATDHSIEYFGWDKLYPENYEQYFANMLASYNVSADTISTIEEARLQLIKLKTNYINALKRYKESLQIHRLSKLSEDF